MKVEGDERYACMPSLVGVASLVSEILQPSSLAKNFFQIICYYVFSLSFSFCVFLLCNVIIIILCCFILCSFVLRFLFVQ